MSLLSDSGCARGDGECLLHVIIQLNAWSRSVNCRFARCGAGKSYSEPLRRVSVINPPPCIDSHGRRCICQNEISGSSGQQWRSLSQPLAITSFTCHSPPTFSLSMPACPRVKTTRAAPSLRHKQRTREETCMCRRQHTNAQTKCDMKDCICCPKGDAHRARHKGESARVL